MYSAKIPSPEKYIIGKARLEEANVSFKDLAEVCRNIRGMAATAAISLLEEAAAGKRPLEFRRHNKRLAHRKELGGKKGRYPKKAAKHVLDVLKSAVANATVFGGNEEQLKVYHAAANKKRIYYRLQPKGRRTRHDYELARLEIIVIQELSEEQRAEVAKKKEEVLKRQREIAEKKKEEYLAQKQQALAEAGKVSKEAVKIQKAVKEDIKAKSEAKAEKAEKKSEAKEEKKAEKKGKAVEKAKEEKGKASAKEEKSEVEKKTKASEGKKDNNKKTNGQ